MEEVLNPILDDVVIVIPSKRPPPVKSLISYETSRRVIIIADPRVLDAHRAWAQEQRQLGKNYDVVEGKIGMIPQSAECYRVGHAAGAKYFFRLDDDITPKFFVQDDRSFPTLEEVMVEARQCAEELGTGLTGFMNTSRVDWFGPSYKRTIGLVHGGAHLCITAADPSFFIDEKLPAYEDVYRSAAHRLHDGAVGRVEFIGLDKTKSLRDSSMSKTPEVQQESINIILGRFHGMVTCKGFRTLDQGRQIIPNWRMVGRVMERIE